MSIAASTPVAMSVAGASTRPPRPIVARWRTQIIWSVRCQARGGESIDPRTRTSATAAAANSRRCGGLEVGERRERRRVALIEAGLEVFGTVGYAESTVEALCAQAGIRNKRYFYEPFPDREALITPAAYGYHFTNGAPSP